MDKFYVETSGRDVSTLCAIKTILNSKQVTKEVEKNYHAVSLFLDKVLDGYLLYYASSLRDKSTNLNSSTSK